MTTFRSGFVAVIGRPNVGKSTLVNALTGHKVSIVSSKPQTTRFRIMGVLHGEDSQLILIDTPGMHRPRHQLGDHMVKMAQRSLEAVDVIVHVVDAAAKVGAGDRRLAQLLAQEEAPVVLILNKADLPLHEATVDEYRALAHYRRHFVVSALHGTGLKELLDYLLAQLPEGPRYYPDDAKSDQHDAAIIAEHVREQVLLLTQDEVPHAVATMVEELHYREGGTIYARVDILVERESQKGILIGQGGGRLKEIGSRARQALEPLLQRPLYLDLWVRVKKDWRNRESLLRALGLSAER